MPKKKIYSFKYNGLSILNLVHWNINIMSMNLLKITWRNYSIELYKKGPIIFLKG